MKSFSVKEILLYLLLLVAFVSFLYELVMDGGWLDPFVVLITIFFEMVIFMFARDILISEMKNVDHATEAADYLKKASVKVLKKRDKFIVYERWQNNVLKETSDDPNKGGF